MNWYQAIRRLYFMWRVYPCLTQDVERLQKATCTLKEQNEKYQESRLILSQVDQHITYQEMEKYCQTKDLFQHAVTWREDRSIRNGEVLIPPVLELERVYLEEASAFLESLQKVKRTIDRVNERLWCYLDEIQTFDERLVEIKQAYIGDTARRQLLEAYKPVYTFFSGHDVEEANAFLEQYKCLNQDVQTWNEEFVARELRDMSSFFDDIDGKILDAQQRRAVVVDEDANLVVAGAGSGKTLTIAAKVKYLVERKQVDPKEILLISFTKKSAEEMQERIGDRLDIPITVRTFHGLGMHIIGTERKEKPDIEDDPKRMIREYCMRELFTRPTQMQRLLEFFGYYFYIPKHITEFDTPGEYHEYHRHLDLKTLKSKYQTQASVSHMVSTQQTQRLTIQDEQMKSLEEVMIANFLFLNGVRYEYERSYPYKTATSQFRQYRPDFYLPDYDIYLEHFGVDRKGNVPWLSAIEEKKYLDGMEWKRKLHREHGTDLIETYSYYAKNGRLLERLSDILLKKGVVFREVETREVLEKLYYTKQKNYFNDFVDFLATFLTLFKSNGYERSQWDVFSDRLDPKDRFHFERTRLFLEIVRPIHAFYEAHLQRTNRIDFNDMINEATRIVTSGQHPMSYRYIIIDEYQDISMSRFRLVQAIREQTKANLMCVGDDWQSIYRFAGSELNLFTEFEKYFGKHAVLKIEKTYRNSQQLIDIAGRFVMKNKRQLRKNLSSPKQSPLPVRLVGFKSKEDFVDALCRVIDQIVGERGETAEVMLVGRNNFDLKAIEGNSLFRLKRTKKDTDVVYDKYPKLRLRFLTAHRSKGLEADDVILINAANSKNGFPNKIVDDPLLGLVLQKQEELAFGEERRLFYVALTRTKRNAYVLTPDHRMSTFVQELIKEQHVPYEVTKESNSIQDHPKCPRCLDGHLVIRQNKTSFLGCSHYPSCNYRVQDPRILDHPVICPSCHGYMVLRKGEYGTFYGCANYPLCRHKMKRETVDLMKAQIKK